MPWETGRSSEPEVSSVLLFPSLFPSLLLKHQTVHCHCPRAAVPALPLHAIVTRIEETLEKERQWEQPDLRGRRSGSYCTVLSTAAWLTLLRRSRVL